MLGCTLFANKSVTHVHVVFLDALHDLTQSGTYSWSVAALVHMYDNLNEASKSTARQLVGYITLLQVSSNVTKKNFIGVDYYMLSRILMNMFVKFI